jgi:hypothetical protein
VAALPVTKSAAAAAEQMSRSCHGRLRKCRVPAAWCDRQSAARFLDHAHNCNTIVARATATMYYVAGCSMLYFAACVSKTRGHHLSWCRGRAAQQCALCRALLRVHAVGDSELAPRRLTKRQACQLMHLLQIFRCVGASIQRTGLHRLPCVFGGRPQESWAHIRIASTASLLHTCLHATRTCLHALSGAVPVPWKLGQRT